MKMQGLRGNGGPLLALPFPLRYTKRDYIEPDIATNKKQTQKYLQTKMAVNSGA